MDVNQIIQANIEAKIGNLTVSLIVAEVKLAAVTEELAALREQGVKEGNASTGS